ncbi:DUF2254 family protein [Nocardia beijingensis]|uniref:DUF2254 family protein n=1 Tax=Nocardia beijingensis TaxID=95162 RepID=A0ABW7W7S2_9NOCA
MLRIGQCPDLAQQRHPAHRGGPVRLDHARVAGLVVQAAERTHGDDPAYGFRKLVDIAERGLAQPFTDPTTAVMVIRLHDCLRQLANRDFPSGRHHDVGGEVRLIERRSAGRATSGSPSMSSASPEPPPSRHRAGYAPHWKTS